MSCNVFVSVMCSEGGKEGGREERGFVNWPTGVWERGTFVLQHGTEQLPWSESK